MKKAIGTAAKESWDVVKNLPYGLAVSPVKLLGMPRRIANAIGATSRELVGIFADSAYAVQNVITGNAPERVGFVKRAGNIIKSYAKVPIGDPRKNIKADFAYEKDKTKALLKRGGEAL